MLDEVFLYWLAVLAFGAFVFIAIIDVLFIVVLWRWEVVSAAHRRRKRERLRDLRQRQRFDKIVMPVAAYSNAVTQPIPTNEINAKELERSYGAPW